MAVEQTLNTAAQFQAATIENNSIKTSSMPVKLETVSGTQQLIDDFNDGVRDPLWLVPTQTQEVFSFETLVSYQVGRLNVPNTGQNLLAQTFTPTQNMSLGAVSMLVDNVSLYPNEGITAQIRTTDQSGFPTSTILGSKFLEVGNWPFPSIGDFRRLQWIFDSPISLQSGTKYAIVLSPSWTPSMISYAEVLGSTAGEYTQGQAFRFDASQSAWLPAIFGVQDYYFKLYEGVPVAEPVETGGFLQFDYPDASGQKFVGTCRNQALYDLELETRFIWDILASPANSSYEFGLHFLRGQIGFHTTDKDDLLIWELIFSPTPTNGVFRIVPVMTDSSGTKRTFISGGGGWVPFDYQFGYLVGAPGNNVPVTFRVTRDQSTQGIKMLAYRNDNPEDIIFDTDVSPVPRALSGDYFFNLGLGINIYASRFKFDYFKVPAPLVEAQHGDLTLRHSFALRSQLTKLSIDRSLPAPGGLINMRYRVADTTAQLDTLPFSDIVPTTVQGNIESGFLSAPLALFCDTKLEFSRDTLGPQLNALALTMQPEIIVPPTPPEAEAAGEDSPIIFSLNEVSPESAKITDSESGSDETANTAQIKDDDPKTQWVSQSSQDGQEVTVTIAFIDSQGSPVVKKLNSLYIRNTNIKQFRVHINDTNLAAGDLANNDSVIAFDDVEADFIQISATSTQTANENKKIGEVYAGRILLTLPGFNTYEPARAKFQSGQFRAISGRLIRYAGISKYSSRWTVTLLSPQDKDLLEKIFRENEFVTFLPEPSFRPREMFDVGWKMEELTFPYSEIFKVPGHTVEVQMEEIGGN